MENNAGPSGEGLSGRDGAANGSIAEADQRLHLQPLQERRAITPALEEGLHATVQPSDTTPAFSQIDPSGSMNNANHLQPMQIALPTGDPSPSGRVPFKLTYYRLTWIFLVSQFGILKGIATYRGANILSASFDLVLGVVVVVVLYIAGLFEEVRPVVWPWFFHQRVPVIHGVLDVTTFLVFSTYMYFIPCTLSITVLCSIPNIGFLLILKRSKTFQRFLVHYEIGDSFLLVSWTVMGFLLAYLSFDLHKVVCKGKK